MEASDRRAVRFRDQVQYLNFHLMLSPAGKDAPIALLTTMQFHMSPASCLHGMITAAASAPANNMKGHAVTLLSSTIILVPVQHVILGCTRRAGRKLEHSTSLELRKNNTLCILTSGRPGVAFCDER